MCTDAYREALTRDLSSTASSAPAPTSSQRQAAEVDREGIVGGPLQRPGQDDPESRGAATAGAVARAARVMAVVKDATVVSGEVIDQREDPSIERAESYARLVAGLAQVGEVRFA